MTECGGAHNPTTTQRGTRLTQYTVHLFRSGRVWVSQQPTVSHDVQPPLLTATVEASTPIAALGKLLLEYVDKANQPSQHVCPPCQEDCCNTVCVCGLAEVQHNAYMSQPHPFTPRRDVY